MPGPIKVLFAVVLVFALICQGCVGSLIQPAPGGEAGLVQASGDDAGGGLQQTSSGGEKVAAILLVGLLLTTVVAIDLLLLPATTHEPFPCCRAVLTICD